MNRLARGCASVLVAIWFVACGSDNSGGTAPPGGSTVVEDCKTACNKAAALHCPNDMPEDCASGCQAQTQLPICQTEFAALVACSAKAPVMCGTDGKASVQGCSNEGLAAITCFLKGADGGAGH
jgi:hypothetical protein